MIRRVATVVTFALSLGWTAQAAEQAPKLDLFVTGYGISQSAVSEILPELHISVLPESFSEGGGLEFNPVRLVWEARDYQLRGRLTEIVVQMRRGDSSLRPPLHLAVPYMEQTVGAYLPVRRIGVSANDIRSMYNELPTSREIESWLTWFFKADAFIEHSQHGSSPDQVRHTTDVERAAVIYAEAVNHLMTNTKWFGEPASFQDRRFLIDKLAESPRIGGGRPLQRVQPYLERAKHHFNRRAFNALKAHRRDVYCDTIFPMAKGLYEDLLSYEDVEYERHREVAGFPRDQVLSLMAACLRNLLSTQDGRQVVFSTPTIESRAFGGIAARAVAKQLIEWHELELESYGVSPPAGSEPPECKADRRSLSRAGELRCDLGYLQEVHGRIVEARNIERIPL